MPLPKSNSKQITRRARYSLDSTAFAQALLAHFDHHRRDLPWRTSPEPYRVWVSEIMLQQTRVETARSYYERWMQRFPDLDALADAPIDGVLKAWEGLGYYSRARNLHRAAQLVRERHHGILPDNLSQLRQLPGIGQYTAGAIASIAYGVAAPAVDGNVKRVLCRLHDAPSLSSGKQQHLAGQLVPADRPGDFNQAMMELGSTICTPRSPRCNVCPVQRFCAACANGTQQLRPAQRPPKTLPERNVVTLVAIDSARKTLIRQRPPTGLLAGLWEFPGVLAEQVDAAAAQALAWELIGRTPRPGLVATISHTFSHFRAHYHVYRTLLKRAGAALEDPSLRWVSVQELADYALPTAQRRIARTALPAG